MTFEFFDLNPGLLLRPFASADELICRGKVNRNGEFSLVTRLHRRFFRAHRAGLSEGTTARSFLGWPSLPLCSLHQSYTDANTLTAARCPAPCDMSLSTDQAPPKQSIAICERWGRRRHTAFRRDSSHLRPLHVLANRSLIDRLLVLYQDGVVRDTNVKALPRPPIPLISPP